MIEATSRSSSTVPSDAWSVNEQRVDRPSGERLGELGLVQGVERCGRYAPGDRLVAGLADGDHIAQRGATGRQLHDVARRC